MKANVEAEMVDNHIDNNTEESPNNRHRHRQHNGTTKKMINQMKMNYQIPEISNTRTQGINGMIKPRETHTHDQAVPIKTFSTKNIEKAKKMEK